ncbi:hypothetical protein L3Y34_018438 [Caenorhabditis briggsae]|uniref:Uncharacterized protein n=1 Tax=Caenorhabditis briggsae TaxID=6238 RepID=A0AAE9DK63_CAEBR|nr:hypothetical protein L3Y34_018438 [Caenorhabditis briggsae]
MGDPSAPGTQAGKDNATTELVVTLQQIQEQLKAQCDFTQSLMKQNQELRDQLEQPRAVAGGTGSTVRRSNARLLNDLSRRIPKFVYRLDEPILSRSGLHATNWFSPKTDPSSPSAANTDIESTRLSAMLQREYPEVFEYGLGTCVKEEAQIRTIKKP